jgi:hypothetical protein
MPSSATVGGLAGIGGREKAHGSWALCIARIAPAFKSHRVQKDLAIEPILISGDINEGKSHL